MMKTSAMMRLQSIWLSWEYSFDDVHSFAKVQLAEALMDDA